MANNTLQKQLCMALVGAGMLISTCASSLDALVSVAQKLRLPQIALTLENKVKNAGSGAKKRIKKIYDCLRGDESCTANEIILTRVIAVIVAIEIYHHLQLSSWWIRIKSRRARLRMERERREAEEKRGPIETSCCCCLSEENELNTGVWLRDLPCPGIPTHPSQICTKCLPRLASDPYDASKIPCPICRQNLDPF